jgi:hypothetical protein
VSREFVKAASEFLAFMILVLAVGYIAPLSFLMIFVVNSIAGTVIADVKLNKLVVPLTPALLENRISLIWGMTKILRNNLWWK